MVSILALTPHTCTLILTGIYGGFGASMEDDHRDFEPGPNPSRDSFTPIASRVERSVFGPDAMLGCHPLHFLRWHRSTRQCTAYPVRCFRHRPAIRRRASCRSYTHAST